MTDAAAGTDPYVPRHGDASYTVTHYDITLGYAIDANRLDAHAVIRARAVENLDRFVLDLHHLTVSKVTVDGTAAAKYSQRDGRLHVRTRTPVEAGGDFAVAVTYRGTPRPMPGPDGDAGWEELADGVIVASQPHGAPSWFPCNDRPSVKSSYRIEVTTASAYHVVANGRLVERRQRANGTTWVYEQDEPMASYLATVQIGRYVALHDDSARPALRTYAPPSLADVAVTAFARQREMIALFERSFGPYPFGRYAVVVTADALEIPLEAQGLSIFGSNFLDTSWQSQRLIAHELCHQWFGNSLTLAHWRDIWLHEGFACYSEWLWSQESGGPSADAQARGHWARLAVLAQDLAIGEPGPESMFDDRVYKRGALTLHALRTECGDTAFFALLRAWVAAYRHGSVTTEQFIALAETHVGRPLRGFFDDWLYRPSLPELASG